jgi:GT2 family glycosyltransferase
MRISVIIATDNRPEVLESCLLSLAGQTLSPDEIIIAHGGSDDMTEGISAKMRKVTAPRTEIRYFKVGPLGAARQRNAGADLSTGDVLFFLDDDVVCEKDYVSELLDVFLNDTSGKVGGACGIIENLSYQELSPLNKFLFDLCLEKRERKKDYAGMVVGPGVNYLPRDIPRTCQEVQWMVGCGCAYRREVFMDNRFHEGFHGYSFMEDVDLSCRVAMKYRLINTTGARVRHFDLGGSTHAEWRAVGRMQVVNRWHVMTKVMGKNSALDTARFVYYQFYCILSESRMLLSRRSARGTVLRWMGRISGMGALLAGRSGL